MTSSRTATAIAALALLAADAFEKDLGRLGAPEGRDPEGWKRKRWQKPPSSGRHAPKVKLRIPGGRR